MWLISSNKKDGINVHLLPMCYLKNKKVLQSFDNQTTILEIVKLRYKRAQLLGYKSHAHFVLEERMAKTPEKVFDFLNELLEKAKPAAKNEFDQLKAFANELDGCLLYTSDAADE